MYLYCDVSCRQDIELVITSDYYSTPYQLINFIFTSSIIITVLILKKSVTVVEVWKCGRQIIFWQLLFLILEHSTTPQVWGISSSLSSPLSSVWEFLSWQLKFPPLSVSSSIFKRNFLLSFRVVFFLPIWNQIYPHYVP